MKCHHQFIKVSDTTRLFEELEEKISTKVTGVRVVCALCAEKRDIFIDGTVHIWKNRGDVEIVELPSEYMNRMLKKDSNKKS